MFHALKTISPNLPDIFFNILLIYLTHKINFFTIFTHFQISDLIITFIWIFSPYGPVKSIVKSAMFNNKHVVWMESWEGCRDRGGLWKAQTGKCSVEWEIWGCIYSQLSRFLSVCVCTDAHVHKNIVFMFAFSDDLKKTELSDLHFKNLKWIDFFFFYLDDLIAPYVFFTSSMLVWSDTKNKDKVQPVLASI